MAKKKVTFEEAMTRLEEIVDRLEREEVPLEEAVKLYQEGLSLSAVCKEKLAAAEGSIVMLRKEAGLWEETPFAEEDMENGLQKCYAGTHSGNRGCFADIYTQTGGISSCDL